MLIGEGLSLSLALTISRAIPCQQQLTLLRAYVDAERVQHEHWSSAWRSWNALPTNRHRHKQERYSSKRRSRATCRRHQYRRLLVAHQAAAVRVASMSRYRAPQPFSEESRTNPRERCALKNRILYFDLSIPE